MSGNSLTSEIIGLTIFFVGMGVVAAVTPICPFLLASIENAAQIGTAAIASDGIEVLWKTV